MKLVRALLATAAILGASAVVQVATAPSASASCGLCWPWQITQP